MRREEERKRKNQKTDKGREKIDNSVVLSDYRKMDKVLEEERNYIRTMVQKIHKTGCNVILIQKSILRDALNDLSLQYLARLKIMVVKDIERSDIEFITNTLGCSPIASIDSFTKEKLGSAELAEEVTTSDGSNIIKITGIPHGAKTVTIFCRASNRLVLDEVDRCIHDALCVVRSLVKKRFIIPGGGAPEIEMSLQLSRWSKTLPGMESYCVRAFADALEIIPSTLAENAGLSPISIVTELRNRHVEGDVYAGIDIKKVLLSSLPSLSFSFPPSLFLPLFPSLLFSFSFPSFLLRKDRRKAGEGQEKDKRKAPLLPNNEDEDQRIRNPVKCLVILSAT